MKYFRVFFVIYTLLLTGCKNPVPDVEEHNLCEENERFIKSLYERGNALFPYTTNYGNLRPTGDYYFFKKHNLVNGIHFELAFSDTCSQEMNKKMLIKKGYDYTQIKWKLDSFQYTNRKSYDRVLRDFDGKVLCWGDIKLPINKNEDFEDELLEEILKIDSTFIASGFWIIVNEEGVVSGIEPYIKHSQEVDSIIYNKLLRSQWQPAYDASTMEKVEVRTEYILYNLEYFP